MIYKHFLYFEKHNADNLNLLLHLYLLSSPFFPPFLLISIEYNISDSNVSDMDLSLYQVKGQSLG